MSDNNFKIWIDDSMAWALRRCISRNSPAAPDRDKIHLSRAYAAIASVHDKRIEESETGDLFNDNAGNLGS